MKAAKAFSSVWQDGKPELAKPVLDADVVSKDLLFGNEIKGFDNWSKMVHGIFEVSILCGGANMAISVASLVAGPWLKHQAMSMPKAAKSCLQKSVIVQGQPSCIL